MRSHNDRCGCKLAAERKAAGLTQQVVAERLGIPRAALSMIEDEKFPLPKGMARRYRAALHVTATGAR